MSLCCWHCLPCWWCCFTSNKLFHAVLMTWSLKPGLKESVLVYWLGSWSHGIDFVCCGFSFLHCVRSRLWVDSRLCLFSSLRWFCLCDGFVFAMVFSLRWFSSLRWFCLCHSFVLEMILVCDGFCPSSGSCLYKLFSLRQLSSLRWFLPLRWFSLVMALAFDGSHFLA